MNAPEALSPSTPSWRRLPGPGRRLGLPPPRRSAGRPFGGPPSAVGSSAPGASPSAAVLVVAPPPRPPPRFRPPGAVPCFLVSRRRLGRDRERRRRDGRRRGRGTTATAGEARPETGVPIIGTGIFKLGDRAGERVSKRAGKATTAEARQTMIRPSSSDWRKLSSTEIGNSANSSRNSTPRCGEVQA